jgi:hypothetical protein
MLANKKRFVIVFGLVLFAVVALFGWAYATRGWTASTRVQLLMPLMMRPNVASVAEFGRNQTALVKSRPVLTKALSNPDVSRLSWVKTRLDPLASLENEIQVGFSTTNGFFIDIALAGDDPDELTVLANAVRDAYVDVVFDDEPREREKRLLKLRQIKDAHVAAQVRMKKAEGKDGECSALLVGFGGSMPASIALATSSAYCAAHAAFQRALKTELDALVAQMKMNLGEIAAKLEQPEEIVKRCDALMVTLVTISKIESYGPPRYKTEPTLILSGIEFLVFLLLPRIGIGGIILSGIVTWLAMWLWGARANKKRFVIGLGLGLALVIGVAVATEIAAKLEQPFDPWEPSLFWELFGNYGGWFLLVVIVVFYVLITVCEKPDRVALSFVYVLLVLLIVLAWSLARPQVIDNRFDTAFMTETDSAPIEVLPTVAASR